MSSVLTVFRVLSTFRKRMNYNSEYAGAGASYINIINIVFMVSRFCHMGELEGVRRNGVGVKKRSLFVSCCLFGNSRWNVMSSRVVNCDV